MTKEKNWLDKITETRRSTMKKGAAAAGALTLGGAGFGTATVGAQDEQVAIFAYRFYPESDFDVLAQVEQSTTVDALQIDDETVPEISQPDEWNGHIIRYDVGREDAGITSLLFIRGASMSRGDSGTMGEDANVLSSELNLLRTSIDGNGGANRDDDDDEDEDEEDDLDEDENVTDEEDDVGNETDDTNETDTGGA